jgi:hypothetical protein
MIDAPNLTPFEGIARSHCERGRTRRLKRRSVSGNTAPRIAGRCTGGLARREIERRDRRAIKRQPQGKEGDVRVEWVIASGRARGSGLDGDNAVEWKQAWDGEAVA